MACDLRATIQKWVNERNEDGTRKWTDSEIEGKIQAALKAGYVSRADVLSASGQDVRMTGADNKRLDELTDKVKKSDKTPTEALDKDELKELTTLLNKSRLNMRETAGTSGISIDKVDRALALVNKQSISNVQDIMEVLDNAIATAENRGDTNRVQSLNNLKNHLKQASDTSSRIKMDWKALTQQNEERERLLIEYGILKSIKAIGTTESRAKREEIEPKVIELKEKVKAKQEEVLEKKNKLEELKKDPSKKKEAKAAKKEFEKAAKELSELFKEFQKNNAILTSTGDKKTNKANEKLDKKLKEIENKLSKLDNSMAGSYFSKILVSSLGIDAEYYTTSLREIEKNRQEIEANIRVREEALAKFADDHKFSEAEVKNLLFTDDLFSIRTLQKFLYEEDKNPDGTVKKDSDNKPVLKKKEFLTKEEVMAIFNVWKAYTNQKMFNRTFSPQESQKVQNELVRGERKLASDVELGQSHETARTHEEAITARPGHDYDPTSQTSTNKAIRDLTGFMGRLNYLASVPKFGGVVDEALLIASLGVDAQSLIHLFDDAVIDNLTFDNTPQEDTEIEFATRQNHLRSVLKNIGFTDSEINQMPEFREGESFLYKADKVISFDLEWDKDSKTIIAASVVTYVNGKQVDNRVIYSSDGQDKGWTQKDANDFLLVLDDYQNNGFKVVGHNTLGIDSDMQRLVSSSTNSRLGLKVSLRSFDTMLLAFRGGEQTNFSRHFGPSLENLANASGFSLTKSMTGAEAFGYWKAKNYGEFEKYITADAQAAGEIFLNMFKKKGHQLQVKNNMTNREETVTIHDIVPMWYDTGIPANGNRKYRGYHHLFDITSFRNIQELQGGSFNRNMQYDIAKVKQTTIRIIVGLMNSNNPNNINNLIDAIARTQDDSIENIESLMELSRQDHKAYLPVLRSIRQRMMASGDLPSGYIASIEKDATGVRYNPARNAAEFRQMTVDSVMEMLKDYYNRNVLRSLQTFADRIGFRDIESGEDIRDYIAELIEFSSTKFNDQDVKIEDYGDGTFDFISAKQLGYGFAQVVLGFVEDGMTLAQSPNTPISKLEERKEESKLAGQALDQAKEEAIIESREFLRPTPKQVSFFAPLSRFEQERAYSDFALRERIKFVTEVTITDKERQAFNDWVNTNPDVEYRNRIKDLKKQIDQAKKDKNDSLVQSLEHYLLKEQENYTKFLKEREEGRLYQGRVQMYHLLNPVKNRDVYNRIPTMQEQKEMALAVSLDLPRFIATFVHDSITYLPDEQVNLDNPLFWKNPALSSGGATGRSLLDGIHPQLAWALQHPITRDAVIASIKEGVKEAKAKGKKFKRTNYFDDKFSGIHHLAALRLMYFPSEELTKNGGLLKTLNDITSRTGEGDLKDYYEETANIFFDEAIPHLMKKASTDEEKEQLLRIEKVLKTAGARNFFKGAVLPVMYSGGLPGVIKGLYKKREEEKSILSGLTDDDLTLIANTLVKSGFVIQGRLIDKVLEMDADARTKLANALTEDTEELSVDTRKEYLKIIATDKNLATGSMSISAAQEGIRIRIEYMAKLLTPPTDLNDKRSYEERWKDKSKQIKEVYQKRIDKALELFKNPDGTFKQIKVGGEDERKFHVALAGDEAAYMNQMTLMFINKAQNAGYKIKFGDNVDVEIAALDKTITIPRNILESNIRNGRMVNKDDVMFHNHTVFFSMGIYSNNGRAGYVGNYLTNPHGGYLSKVERIVYKTDADGAETSEIDWDETVANSMWSLQDNPLYGKNATDAANMVDDLMIRNYAMFAAPDYAPTFLGYDPEVESRENFFKQWSERSSEEYFWEQWGYPAEVEALRAEYAKQGITLTDEMIADWQKSNLIPRDKAIRTRVTVNDRNLDEDDIIMTNNDAKGLGAFRPRYADYSFEDRIVHGLYSIYQGSKQMNLGAESLRAMVNKNKQQGTSPSEILKMDQRRGHVYDVEKLPYVPQYDSSLIDELRGLRLTALQRINQRRYVLDTFAVNSGMLDELNNQEYARIHQTHEIRNKILKFAKLLSRGIVDPRQSAFLHTNFIREIHKITKAQRDASGKERNLLDFAESIGIDPTLFQNDDGTNVTYLDMLVTLADLGVDNLAPITLGISPTQFVSTDPNFKPEILKNESTGTLPLTVQGEDVATLILGVFSNDTVQKVSTEYVKEAIKSGRIDGSKIRFDKNTKFVLLSSVPVDVQEEIIMLVIKDPQLVNGAITNMGLGISITSFGGENRLKFIINPEHQMSGPNKKGTRIIRRIGIGTPSVNRTVVGESSVAFYFTFEDVKAMLTAFANDGLISRVETSLQIRKSLGGPTRVDQLQRQRYSEFWEIQRQALAEETETLQSLDPNLSMLRTDRLKDELGIDLNLYDAVFYFDEAKFGYNPFRYAATIDIRAAISKGKLYPSLSSEVKELEILMADPEMAAKIGMLVTLHYNSRDFTVEEQKNILRDLFMGTKSDEEIESEILPKFNEIIKIIDKINFSPMKGKNKLLGPALKFFDNNFVSEVTVDTVELFMKDYGIDPKDQMAAVDALKQAHRVRQVSPVRDIMTAYPDIGTSDLLPIAATPDSFEKAFPEGSRINAELRLLIDKGIIDEEMAAYYRFLIAKVLKHNPNLAKYLSISADDLGNNPAAAVKEGDRFRIVLNTNFDKRLGKVDQLRIFAHEMGHIARLAFIETNGAKWRNMESLLRSQKGRQAIETMMLAMNNGKKYDGFDSDLAYYTDNPEEFAAQWAGWLLLKNTFGNSQMMKLLQSRSSIAWTATNIAREAFHHISNDILQISTVLDSMDVDVKEEILGMVEDMFGFTSAVERNIYTSNPDTKLFMVSEFNPEQVEFSSDLSELEKLDLKIKRGTATTAEIADFNRLDAKLNRVYGNEMPMPFLEYRRQKALRESLAPPKRNRNAVDRVTPGNAAKPVEMLSEPERQEIVQTLLINGRAYAGKLSTSSATIGGLSREVANKVFGKHAVSVIVNSRRVLTLGGDQSVYTKDNPTDVVALLLHLAGESFALTEHQFKTELGSRSLMENRNYAKQWANRVSVEISNLRAMVKRDQVDEILKYAYAKAAGHSVPPPTFASAEQLAQATEVVNTLFSNAMEMRRLIHGGNADSFDLIPVMLSPKVLGTKNRTPSNKERARFKSEKMNLFDSLVTEIETDFANNDLVHSIILHTSGMVPRVKAVYREEDIPQYTTELERIRKGNPATMRILMEVAIAEIVKEGLVNAATARLIVERGASPTNPVGIWQYTMPTGTKVDLVKYFHKASTVVYKAAKHKKAIPGFITDLGISVPSSVVDDFRKEVQAELAPGRKNPNFLFTDIYSINERANLPEGLQYPLKNKDDALGIADTPKIQTPESTLHAMASMQLMMMGSNPDFMLKNQIVTQGQMLRNPQLNRFLSPHADQMMIDLERSKGFRAASEIAIEDMTGIRGYNIYDMISIVESVIDTMQIHPAHAKDDIKTALKVIKQKLEIEQGLSRRGLEVKENLMTDVMVRWGPDIVKMFFGGSLNAASLLMEGTTGALVSTAYGGNPAKFMTDLIGTWVGTFPHLFAQIGTYNPRGMAINMMRGMEEMAMAARLSNEDTSSHLYSDIGKWDRVRAFYNRMHGQTYLAVASALGAQAQRIIISHANNGNLDKLKLLFATTPLRNMSELRKALRTANITGINSHMAFELKQAGMFEEKNLEIFKWFLANVKTKSGVVNMNEALKSIENMTDVEISKLGFSRPEMYRAASVIYKAQDNFRNIAMVSNNAFDSDTNVGGLQFLISFYRQYPNLFFSQMVVRQGAKMSKRMFASMLVAVSIMDIVYNLLLAIALGSLPITALFPWSDDFVGKKNPARLLQTLIGRNPYFGVTANTMANTIIPLAQAMMNENPRDNRGAFRDSLENSFALQQNMAVPAITQMSMELYDMIDVLVKSGGNMNEAQTHEFMRSFINGPGRAIPGIGGLFFRVGTSQVLGPKPQPQSVEMTPEQKRKVTPTRTQRPQLDTSRDAEIVRKLKKVTQTPIVPPDKLR